MKMQMLALMLMLMLRAVLALGVSKVQARFGHLCHEFASVCRVSTPRGPFIPQT